MVVLKPKIIIHRQIEEERYKFAVKFSFFKNQPFSKEKKSVLNLDLVIIVKMDILTNSMTTDYTRKHLFWYNFIVL